MALTIRELTVRLAAQLIVGDDSADCEVTAVQPVAAAGPGDITFVTDAKHQAGLRDCQAVAVIVAQPIDGLAKPQLVVGDVNAALIETLNCLAPKLTPPTVGVDASARVAANVRLGDGVSIGPYTIVEGNVEIGNGAVIGSGCQIGENSRIGAHCRLDSHVVVYHGCVLGEHVTVQANSTIGAVGFGYAFIDGAHRLVPHNGGVIIEDFVEIGANACVDRAKFGNTIIGAGTKMDNLVQIGHNVVIGKCCLIASQVGIAGSCRLGDGVVLAGQVGLADNIAVGDGTMVGAQAGVMGTVGPGLKLAWSPAIDVREATRVIAHILRLPKVAQQLKDLAAKVEELEAAKDHTERG